MNQQLASKSSKIVVTGFGPFGNHKINASWEAVKMLSTLDIGNEFGVELVTVEIPVEYDKVEKIIPDLWETHKPLLMVHVGVSSVATELTLETEAHRSGYCLLDTRGQVPATGCCCRGSQDCVTAALDVPAIADSVAATDGLLVCFSSNAGRYLCEYTYYLSLTMDRSRSLFIHVPELNKPYSAEELARGIKGVLREMLRSVAPQTAQSDNSI